MAQPKPQEHSEVDFMTNAENFFEQNKQAITIGGGAVLVLGLALMAFFGFYVPSQEKGAQEQMFHAQQYFERDSFNLALNGDGNNDGFLAIIDNYGFTKSSKLSHYYAGVCYLRTGQFDDAITHLKKYSGSDPIVSGMALGALGDAYSEKGNMDEAISYYKKAANEAENGFVTPYFLFKAGLGLKTQGKNADALKLFQQIKNEYPDSAEGGEIDKYIAMVS